MAKRFAVINCYPTSHGLHSYGAQLWVDALRDDGEEWVIFNAAIEGHCPTPDEARTYAGLVISGSPHGVYEDLPWMRKIVEVLKAVYVPSQQASDDSAPRVVGGCFGAQIIGEALGGKVEKQGYMLLRADELVPTPAFHAQPFAVALQQPAVCSGTAGAMPSAPVETGPIRLISCHGDCVRKLPPDAQLLATSTSTQHELFLVGRNVMGIQSHPEFEYEREVLGVLWPRNVDQLKRLDEEQAQESRRTFEKQLHGKEMLEVLRRFMKRA